MTTQIGATTKTRFDYTYNALGQKESAKQSGQSGTAFADLGGDTFYRYVYNSRGELTQAAGYLGSNVTTLNAPLPGRLFDYGYDQAGNRQNANNTGVAGLQADYTANGLNQLATRENHYVPVSGTVDAAAKVVVNGTLAGQQGNYWSGEAVLNNTNGPAYTASLAVKAAMPSPQTKQVSGLLAAFLPAALEEFHYDLDGNLTADGQWDYTWDAENRLVKMETKNDAMTAGLPGRRLVFRYDSLGRRTAKEIWSYSGGSWSKSSEVRFVYQGWNLVAELDTLGNRLRTHAWGLDLGGSLTAMGSIGALVQTVDHTGTVASYLPGYDGQGNVAAVMKSDGTIAARYEYSPFGETLRREGDYAATNPFRSATKYTDDESGLVYYGTRYYSPSLGRFLNRDSISEAGGVNLYAFVGNNPTNAWDYLGMDGGFMTFEGNFDINGNWRVRAYDDGPSGWEIEQAKISAAGNIGWMSYAEQTGAAAFLAAAKWEASQGNFSWLAMLDPWALKAKVQNGNSGFAGLIVTGSVKAGGITVSNAKDEILYQGALDRDTGEWLDFSPRYAPNSGTGGNLALDVAGAALGGAGSYLKGLLWTGPKGLVVGTYNLVTSPIETTRGLANGLGTLAGNLTYNTGDTLSAAGNAMLNPENIGVGVFTAGTFIVPGAFSRSGGLTTPRAYFGSRTAQEVSEALTQRYGPARSVRDGAETFYNPQTQRSFNVHTDPAHGPPHVDIRRRGGFDDRKYDLSN